MEGGYLLIFVKGMADSQFFQHLVSILSPIGVRNHSSCSICTQVTIIKVLQN